MAPDPQYIRTCLRDGVPLFSPIRDPTYAYEFYNVSLRT